MITTRFKFSALAASVALLAGLQIPASHSTLAQTPSPEDSSCLLIASSNDGHVHLAVFTAAELDEAIRELPSDDSTLRLDSSSAFDHGAISGSLHSHSITITKRQLIQLRDIGSVTVTSDSADGHSHSFNIVSDPEGCVQKATPSPGSTSSPASPLFKANVPPKCPAPTATVTVTPKPTPTVTKFPTPKPSPKPSKTVITFPTKDPQPTVTVLPPIE